MPEVVVTGGHIPPDIQYYLDGAAQCFDIPPDVYLWARTFHPDITSVLDGFDADPELRALTNHSTRLTSYGDRLEQMYLVWQETASFEEVALCLGFGMQWSPTMDQFLGEVVNTIVDSSTGALSRIYKEYETHTKGVLVFYDGQKMFERKRGFLESLYRIEQQWNALEVQPTFEDYNVVYPRRTHGYDQEMWIDEIVAGGLKKPPLTKNAKKALKRSADLLDGVTGSKTTQLFLSGKEVIVTGQKYKFVLTKHKHSPVASNHGSAQTDVYDLASGEFVAGLCVYTPNVTVFDHLASLVLHCKSGLEEQIILDANITRRGNDLLLPEAKRKKEKVVDLDLGNPNQARIARAINGENYLAIEAMRDQLTLLNDKMKQKTIAKIKRRYAGIIPRKQVRIERIRTLFYGPEAF